MHEHNIWIKERAGQLDCRSRIDKDGAKCSTGESDGKADEEPVVHR